MDELLFESRGPSRTVYWRPGYGRRITPTYRNFPKVVRTVHILEALDICQQHKMQPKQVLAAGILNQRRLRNNHPCKNMQVLWFGTQPPSEKDEDHDWYGNVQFAMPADVLLQRWKYCFLVELMTARTHTATRLLITNKDYSMALPQYNPHYPGGPWFVNANGHFVLDDCARYNDEGFNKHGHTLEFIIEVTQVGQRNILDECEISFRNHSQARNYCLPQRCHRAKFTSHECPAPHSSAVSARLFFYEHQKRISVSYMATPKLSEKAEYFRQCHYMMSNGPSSISHRLNIPQQRVALPPSQFPPYAGHLLNGLAPTVDPFFRNAFTHTSARVLQYAGCGSRVLFNQYINSNFMGNYSYYELQIIFGSSLYGGDQHNFFQGCPTPNQQNRRRRRRRIQNNREQHPQYIRHRS